MIASVNFAGLRARERGILYAIRGKTAVIPQTQADRLVRSVKNGRKVVNVGGSHAPYGSDPATFNTELLNSLSQTACFGA